MAEGKVFDIGIVSYNLYTDFYENQVILLNNLKFLCEAGFETQKLGTALDIVETFICDGRKELDEYFEKGFGERTEAGGSHVEVIPIEEEEPDKDQYGGNLVSNFIKLLAVVEKQDKEIQKDKYGLLNKMVDNLSSEFMNPETEIQEQEEKTPEPPQVKGEAAQGHETGQVLTQPGS